MVDPKKAYHKELLQEILWPNRWQCTVACVLLNLTTKKQVDKVWPQLFEIAPTPEALVSLPQEELIKVIRPLGLYNLKATRLKKMASFWGKIPYNKLPGVGAYALQSDRIFFQDDLLEGEKVVDHVLEEYVEWRKKQKWKNLS